jgi:hypothetical protein
MDMDVFYGADAEEEAWTLAKAGAAVLRVNNITERYGVQVERRAITVRRKSGPDYKVKGWVVQVVDREAHLPPHPRAPKPKDPDRESVSG